MGGPLMERRIALGWAGVFAGLRRSRSDGQRLFAAHLGVTQAYLARLELGQATPSADLVFGLARLCRVDVEALYRAALGPVVGEERAGVHRGCGGALRWRYVPHAVPWDRHRGPGVVECERCGAADGMDPDRVVDPVLLDVCGGVPDEDETDNDEPNREV